MSPAPGSLVTIMAFGIPGDAVTAVMLGAMFIRGIQPGPLFGFPLPISDLMLGLSVISVALALWQHRRTEARIAESAKAEVEF